MTDRQTDRQTSSSDDITPPWRSNNKAAMNWGTPLIASQRSIGSQSQRSVGRSQPITATLAFRQRYDHPADSSAPLEFPDITSTTTINSRISQLYRVVQN